MVCPNRLIKALQIECLVSFSDKRDALRAETHFRPVKNLWMEFFDSPSNLILWSTIILWAVEGTPPGQSSFV